MALVGDGLERSADQMAPTAAAGQPHDGPAGVHIPVRRAESREGGYNIDAAVVRNLRGIKFAVGGLLDQAELVTDPLDHRAADKDAALHGVADFSVQSRRDGGDQAMVAQTEIPTGVHQHKTTGTVGVFGFARLEAGLPEQGGLLISGAARDRDADAGKLGIAVNFTAAAHFGKHLHGDVQCVADGFVPAKFPDIEQHGAGSIGIVGYVHLATGELPNNPGINSTEKQATSVSLFAHTGDIF